MAEPLVPCSFPKCPAVTTATQHYCVVHALERVMERVRAVVMNNFDLAGRHDPATRKLRDDILFDLENTI